MILVLGAGVALAQAVFGVITGNVTDPSGASIPKAKVITRDLDRGTTFDTPLSESGGFTQTHLLPGRYEVRVSAPGFAEYVRTVIVQVDTTTRVDVQLTVGQSSEKVIVSAEAPILKTDRSDVSTTLTAAVLYKLPILDRNPTSLLTALPGGGLYSGPVERPPAPKTSSVTSRLPSTASFRIRMAFCWTARRTTATSSGFRSSFRTPMRSRNSR